MSKSTAAHATSSRAGVLSTICSIANAVPLVLVAVAEIAGVVTVAVAVAGFVPVAGIAGFVVLVAFVVLFVVIFSIISISLTTLMKF
jgi:hypothetical protein